MHPISEDEKSRRRRINQSVIGTNAMEDLTLDDETLNLMRRYEEGEIERDELSSSIDLHVARLLRERSALAGAA